ncbi:MAG: alcohol dehydrogenase [candidate division NC10 bacterium RIFCSPLOWO2_12_FULL_66_18]|nr:MAG: alcohol dehydrogenase [candidate division NC10 bacterium RIFCSPLOWO2_02_FULL_66_22]OGB97138.1 MAG: alcohol dehydrogenase [candidate division NC10 bacterium RIFCSPLOWO2_12_FULL_66_18]
MKTVRFHEHGGPEVLRYEEVPEPTPTPTQVTLRVKAVALNHLDIWLRKGLPGVKVPLPKIGGCDIAGEVVAVGSACTRVKPGERIMVSPGWTCGQCAACLRGEDNLCRAYQIIGGYGVDGGCADFLCVPEVNCIPIPERLDYPSAAAVPLTFLTAWNMLRRQARLKPGEDVLVMGAGSGVGTAAIQIAKLVGARVIAVASTDEKLAKATALGADAGINYASQDLGQEIRRLTGKRGVDVVFEHVGGTTWEKLIPNIAPGGRLVTCGATAGHDAKVDIRYLFSKTVAILGAFMGCKADLLEVVRYMGEGTLRPVVDRTLPLSECAEAHRLIEDRAVFGKIVLLP